MAGQQVEVAASQIDKQRLGYMAISLTNYDNDSEPQIAAGSKVEIAGALFEFTADESISGWGGIGNNNDVYIKLVVSGTAVTAEFTTTAPTWSTSKQGWYGTGGAALHRYVAKLRKDGAGAYTLKRFLRQREYIETADIAALAVTKAKVGAAAIDDSKIDKTLSPYGSQVINDGASWVVPAGVYIMTGISLNVQVYDGAAWQGYSASTATIHICGAVISDGTNVRILNASGSGSKTVYYRKLA